MLPTVTSFQKHTAGIYTRCPNTLFPHKITLKMGDNRYLFNNAGPTNFTHRI